MFARFEVGIGVAMVAMLCACVPHRPTQASPEPAPRTGFLAHPAKTERPSPKTDAEHQSTKPNVMGWRQLSPREGDQVHYDIHFQDPEALWQCEGNRCRVVDGPGAERSVGTPCDAYRSPTKFSSPSKSGRWLLQACNDTIFVVDLNTGSRHETKVGGLAIHLGVIDDGGTATVSIEYKHALLLLDDQLEQVHAT